MAGNSTGGKKTVFFSLIKSKRSKDRGKPEKDPSDVAQSSVAAAVAQPKDKQSSKAKKEEKKREKSRRSSSKSSVGSPPSGSARDSFILQSPSVLAEGRPQHGSPPGGEESAFSENSSEATRGELFPDDPLKVAEKTEPPAECEVKRKPLDEHSLETHLKQIELQLQEKEKDFPQDSSNKSLPERLQALLGHHEERCERVSSEKHDMARAHEKARKRTVEEHLTEIETKKSEAKLKHEKEVAQIKEALEEKLQEEKETMIREHAAEREKLEREKLKMEAEGEKKRREEEQTSMKSEHARELGKLRDEVEQMTTRLKGTEDELLHKLEQLKQENQALVEQMREEAQREVLQTKQAVTQKEEENLKLSDEVAERKTKCGEQQATITELENSATATTTKLHSQERLARSYEDKMRKLEQRLEHEKMAKTAASKEHETQGQVQGDNFQTELKKKEEELIELQTQLQTAKEQLHEEKTKSATELQTKEENLEQLQLQLQSTQKQFQEEKTNTEEELERNKEELERLDQLLQNTQRELQEQEEKREIEFLKKEEELAEAQRQLDATQERLREQEEKREESQIKLESFQRTMKAEASTAKSATDLDEYFDNMTKLCEEMTKWKKKSEDLKKEVDKLQKVVDSAELMEKAYVETATKLSEAEANKEALHSQAPAVAGGGGEGGKQSSGAGATWTGSSPEPHGGPSVRRLKREVQDLREKLQARDEEVRSLKSQQGNTPLANPPLSPTDSMAAETGEVASLKLKLKERETKLHNLEVQVGSMERDLQEREKLKRTSESLRSDVEKLTREKKTLSEYSKQQSQQVLSLKKLLEAKQRETQTKMTADLSQSGEIQRWKTAAETAQQELQSFMTKVEDLTRELDRQRSEKAAAMEIARQFKEKAESLKEEVEKTKLGYSVFQEENQRLKQMVEEVKSAVTAEKKASFVAADEHKKEVGMLKEGSHEKDVLMQRASDDIKQLESQLTAAEGKYKELEECNRDILRSQEQANQDVRQNEELEKLKEEVKVKTAQVTQFKKQLEGKNNTIPTEQVEKLQIELATSRSSLEDTAKQLKHLSFKHAEMEKQYAKKIQEIEKQLQVMKGENMRMVKESETHRKLLEKQKELQLNQAQMQQAEMANELTRLQRARNREDEFSKAFHEEFEAHRVMKAKYAELQHQLDAALDSLDEMRQKQEVLIRTLIYHRVEVPFVEPRQLPPANMAQATAETLQWSTQPPTPVAISQKPIASPGVFNQGVDRLSYMPPHSNAEFQYQEQQAEQRVSHWQQQQHMYQQTGMERGGPPLSPQPQAALAVPSCQQADTDAVVGIPASAVIRPIVPRSSQHLSHTTHLPGALQSRHSDSEIQSGRVVREQQLYPLSPHRTCNPNAQLPLTVGEVSGMGQNQPQKAGHPQLQPGLRGKSQPNVYSGDPQQQQGGVVMGQPQPPNSDMGPAQMVNRGDPQPHGHSPHMDLSGGNFLARDQPPKHQNVFSPPSQAVEFVGQHDPYRQQPNSQAPSSRTPLMPVPSAETTNAATDLCFQRQQPLASQPYKTTLPGGAHPSQYPQAEFVKPVAETVLPPQACPSANPAVIEFNERSETGTTSVAPRKASDANDEEQGLMENLSTTIKATFEEINEEEPTPSIQSGLQSLPPDPNLQCVMCGKVFKIGQIQNFKRHSETCTGTRSK